MGEVAAEAVELPDQRAHRPSVQGVAGSCQDRPIGAEAGGEVVVEVDRVVDAGRPQGVHAQITMRSISSTVTVSAVRS